MNLSPRTRTRTLILHDLGVFVAALVAGLLTINGPVTWAVLVAVVATAAKVTLRQVLPVPARPAVPVVKDAGQVSVVELCVVVVTVIAVLWAFGEVPR